MPLYETNVKRGALSTNACLRMWGHSYNSHFGHMRGCGQIIYMGVKAEVSETLVCDAFRNHP